MEVHGLDVQRLEFFVSAERFLEAAELEYAEGHLENAYRLCLKCGSREALLLCTRSLVSLLILSFPSILTVRDKQLELLAQTLPLGCSDDWDHYSEPLKKATGYAADCDRVLQRIEGDFQGREKIEFDVSLPTSKRRSHFTPKHTACSSNCTVLLRQNRFRNSCYFLENTRPEEIRHRNSKRWIWLSVSTLILELIPHLRQSAATWIIFKNTANWSKESHQIL